MPTDEAAARAQALRDANDTPARTAHEQAARGPSSGRAPTPAAPAVPPPGVDLAGPVAAAIEALANELFRSSTPDPASASGVASGLGTTRDVGSLPALAGGAPALPTPGPLQQPPIASSPIPDEPDARPLLTLASHQLGQPVPYLPEEALPHEALGGPPYFLELAQLTQARSGVSRPILPLAGPPRSTASVPLPGDSTPSLGAHPEVSQRGSGQLGSPPVGANGLEAPLTVPTAVESAPTRPGELPDSRLLLEFSPRLAPEPEGHGPVRTAPTAIFDPASIKRDFPILSESVHGRPLVWLDNAATTQKPRAVIDRLRYFYEHENSNVHRAAHTLAARSTDAYEGARERVRRFLNAPSTNEIVFVRGATEAINLVAQSFGRAHVSEGDEIVVTWLEHHANIVPWQQLAAEKGAKLKVAPVDDRGEVMLDEFEKLLGPRTRIVSLSHVSNALGTVVPAAEMVTIAHRYGATVLVDGAQAVSHLPVDVQALDADFYVFSGHKVFGPTGIGALYGRRELLAAMPPWQGGGNMIADVRFERTIYQPPPARFEAGTGNIADAVGLGAALDYVSSLGLANIERYEHELREYGERCLREIPGLRIIGDATQKAGVISFVLDGVRTEDVSELLDREGIAVRSGHHCAQPILRRFGLESTVRASLAPYNTREDLDALARSVRRLQLERDGLR